MNKKLTTKDWSYLGTQLGVEPEDLEVAALRATHPRLHEIGLGFQHFLYGLVLGLPVSDDTREPVVVETGVRTGVSTHLVLKALAERKSGSLFSCDPTYREQGLAENRFREFADLAFWKGNDDFSRWRFFGEKSATALAKIAELVPVWDVFVHDSAHDAKTMKFELDFAWKHLRDGGFMVVDDYFGTEVDGFHKTFEEWAIKNDVAWSTIGQAAILHKPRVVATIVTVTAEELRKIEPSMFGRVDAATTTQIESAKELTSDSNFKTIPLEELLKEPTLEEMEAAVEEAAKKVPAEIVPAAETEESPAPKDDADEFDVTDLNSGTTDDDLDDLETE